MSRKKARLFGGIALVLIFSGAFVGAHFAPDESVRPGDIYSGYIIFAIMILLGVKLIIDYFRKTGKSENNNSGMPTKSERQDWYDGPVQPYDFTVLSEIAAILTNGNQQAVGKMELLGRDYKAFFSAHSEWCANMGYDTETFNPSLDMANVFAMWLCGYFACGDEKTKDGPELEFGVFMDWKIERDNFVGGLDVISKNLGYNLNLDEIVFNGNELTDAELDIVILYLSRRGVMLADLGIGSDSFQLFVIKIEDHERLLELADIAGFHFGHNLFT